MTSAVIRLGLLAGEYTSLEAAPSLVMHGEVGLVLASDASAVDPEVLASAGTFRSRALTQAWAPCARVASLSEDELLNWNGDDTITVQVIPLAAVPTAMADVLRQHPIAGPIPASVPDASRHHRSLKQIRSGFLVEVIGTFTKPEILRFAEHVDLDVGQVNGLLRLSPVEGHESGDVVMRAEEGVRFVIEIEVQDVPMFKEIVARCVDVTRTEPGTLAYDWYLDEETGKARLYEAFESIDAVEAHMTGPVFTDVGRDMPQCSKFIHVDAFGEFDNLGFRPQYWPTSWWGSAFASLAQPPSNPGAPH